MLQALAGRKLEHIPAPLEEPLDRFAPQARSAARCHRAGPANERRGSGRPRDRDRDRSPGASGGPRRAGQDAGRNAHGRGNRRHPSLLGGNDPEPLQTAAISALGFFADDRIATAVLDSYSRLPAGSQARAIELLCSRSNWALELLGAIDAQAIKPAVVSLDQLQRLREKGDERIVKLVARHWGRVQAATPLEKQGRIRAVQQMLARGPGRYRARPRAIRENLRQLSQVTRQGQLDRPRFDRRRTQEPRSARPQHRRSRAP